MQNNKSFYKTAHERILANVVDSYYNDEIGGRENHYLDTGELLPITEQELITKITDQILKCKTVLWAENGFGIEPKHIRFIGKQRVYEIVSHRVDHRHKTDGKWSWEA